MIVSSSDFPNVSSNNILKNAVMNVSTATPNKHLHVRGIGSGILTKLGII